MAIALATLTPAGGEGSERLFACVFCGDQALADAVRNAVLYVPLGAGLSLIGVRPRRAVLAGAVLSAAIEVLQILLPGRDSSIGDVLANTAGTALGVFAVMSAPLWFRPPRRTAGALAVGWAAGVLGVWWLTGWLLAPSFPETVYYGQWTPNLGYLDWYRGKVLDAKIGDREVRSRRIPDSEAVRRALLTGDPIDLRFVAGLNTPRLSSIFSVYDDRHREIVLIGPRGNDLVIRYRTQAAQLGLAQPALRLVDGAAGWRTGDTTAVVLHRARSGWWIQRGTGKYRELGFTVGSGWTVLFYPASLPEWAHQLLDLLWLAALLAPIGYWIRARSAALGTLATTVLGALGVPLLVGLRATPGTQWAAIAVGGVLGAAAGWIARNRWRNGAHARGDHLPARPHS